MASPENDRVTVRPALLAEVQAVAGEERRSADELVEDALAQYLEAHRWRRLYAHGEAQAQARGLTEADVPRLIAEVRAESAERNR